MTRPAQAGVAVIGCGSWGSNHVRLWRELGCLRLVCDVDPLRLEEARARYPDVELCGQVTRVLARPDITAVVIATPAPTHASLALQAMEAGKDVLVEKPMALTAAQGENLLEASERLRRVLAVGHVLEYHPAVRKLQELISEGALGRIRYLYANRVNLGHIRTEENSLWSFAPHDVAIMLRLVGAAPDEVGCQGGAYLNDGVADFTLTSLRFRAEVLGHIFVSWLHPFKEHRFVVVGERQMAVFDDTAPPDEKLLLYPHQVGWLGPHLPVARKAQAVSVQLDKAEPLRNECEDFLRCTATRSRPLADGRSGLEVLRVLEAAQRSLEQGGAPQAKTHPTTRNHFIHPSATMDAGARVGESSCIWHYSHVMAGATIGRGSVLGQNVFVGRGVRIGDGVKIQNNVSVYEGVELEDYVFCGPSMVFTNVHEPRSEIDRKADFGRTLVRRGATLGANSTVLPGLTIGRYALVAAGAVVTKSVPDHALVMGVPARTSGWVCECGARLAFDEDTATCAHCTKRYRRVAERVSRDG